MLDYFTDTTVDKEFEIAQIAAKVYKTACREEFTECGFALIKLPATETSKGLRQKIVDLKDALSDLHQNDRGTPLGWFNMTRFDQQTTTKPHRDASPSESLLILGYEPTPIESSLLMADYSKCAYEMGITPDAFLADFNPMYEKGLEKLAPFITRLGKFDKTSFQILVINNSSQAYSVNNKSWCGVLHAPQ